MLRTRSPCPTVSNNSYKSSRTSSKRISPQPQASGSCPGRFLTPLCLPAWPPEHPASALEWHCLPSSVHAAQPSLFISPSSYPTVCPPLSISPSHNHGLLDLSQPTEPLFRGSHWHTSKGICCVHFKSQHQADHLSCQLGGLPRSEAYREEQEKAERRYPHAA